MIKKNYFKLFILMILYQVNVNSTYADEPPSFQPFSVCIEKNPYCAEISLISKKSDFENHKYQLTIRKTSDERKEVYWSVPFDYYTGYPEGILSPDGKTFVVISYWYDPKRIITIYTKNKKSIIPGTAFQIPNKKLAETESHQLWLSRQNIPFTFIDNNHIFFKTIDHQRYQLNLENNTIKPYRFVDPTEKYRQDLQITNN